MAKRKRFWNGQHYEEVTAFETNGNLTLIEKKDGSYDWVAPFELERGDYDDEWGDRAFRGYDSDRERFGSDY